MDKFVLILLARPLGSDRGERDQVIAVGENVVQRETCRAPGKLGDLAEQRNHLGDTLVVARQRAAAGNVPDDVLGEELTLQRAEVSAAEGRVGLPHPVLAGLRHLILPLTAYLARYAPQSAYSRSSACPRHGSLSTGWWASAPRYSPGGIRRRSPVTWPTGT